MAKLPSFRRCLLPLLSFLRFTNAGQKQHSVFPKQIQTSQVFHRNDEGRTVVCAFTRGSGHPEKLLVHNGLARRSSTGFRAHTTCPSTASEDPDDPESVLLKGMPHTYKGVITDSREKLKDLYMYICQTANKSLTLKVCISCLNRELNLDGSVRDLCCSTQNGLDKSWTL